MLVHRIARDGVLDEHVATIRAAYAERRDALVEALGPVLPEGASLDVPGGGFFVWVTLPTATDAQDLLVEAEAAGVGFVPGGRFGLPGAPHPSHALRLAFCGHPPERLREGVRRLAGALSTVAASPSGSDRRRP
jgi:2-aminoadipate transaminase